MRLFMPLEFIVVAVAFFDTKWTQEQCQHFFLFEPICTAILLAAASVVHVIRVSAIYDKNRAVMTVMGFLLAVQVVVTAVSCGFYFSVPLKEGQGCIAGPKHKWVGIYWVAPTLLYTVSFALALIRSFQSLAMKPLGLWKLMLRDGLNLYGAVWLVNMVNMLFWFIIKPTGEDDPIRTIVTSIAAVLTTSMTLRIVLSVRGSLEYGGSFAHTNASSSQNSRSVHISGRSAIHTNISTTQPHTYTLEDMRSKGEGEWHTKTEPDWSDNKSNDTEVKPVILETPKNPGVKITVDKEIGYDQLPYRQTRKPE
jgi:hypothetical protein